MSLKRSMGSARPGPQQRPRAHDQQAVSSATAGSPILSEKQRRHLRRLAHDLNPVIRLGGAGLTDGIARETHRALHDHELIKVKAPGGGDREARDALFDDLARRTSSALVQRIGNVAVLYRPRPDLPRILLPDNRPVT